MSKQNLTRGKYPELLSTAPRKTNALSYLGTEPYARAFFRWGSNPIVGYKHVTDPSKKSGSPTPRASWGKSLSKLSTRKKESYPF